MTSHGEIDVELKARHYIDIVPDFGHILVFAYKLREKGSNNIGDAEGTCSALPRSGILTQ